ncbi:MAG TPA: hypothetical protein PLC15_05410 [Candidatus Obscuribacter sp.]|nr:hypothetical protein [Candidatus Obscuribacter sp.]HMX45426.1 hypothetical protein [Candidatus Obscuribacter sp.]HNB14793.1 hypothetical protein [Candidatus Obscuribacter sp.]HND68358.1 hypothetical protein [Candidatus Obscuribacter sp.]HNG77051.1 hypothetical protein [Candidatus Obscuribacter sp.]
MGTTRWIRLAFGMFLLFLPFLIFVVSCYPGEQPSWYQKYEELESLNENVDSPKWRQLAGEILQESGNYSGRMPPPRKMTWSQKVFESLFSWLPMQDAGETLSYGQALREIADSYWRHGSLNEAKQYLSRAVQLESSEQLLHPEITRKIGRSELVALLKQMGQLKEAAVLQKQSVDEALGNVERHTQDENLKNVLWSEKAKYYELQENIKEEEACWKNLVALHEDETSKENLVRVRAENMTAGKGVSYSLNVCHWLDQLASFYERHKDYDKQETVLLRTLSLQEATFPERDPRMCRNYEAMADFYIKHENYRKAAEYVLQSLRCQETPDSYDKLAHIYDGQKDYDAALKAMFKCVQLTEASSGASGSLNTTVYLRYAKLLEKAGKTEEGKRWRVKAAKHYRARWLAPGPC